MGGEEMDFLQQQGIHVKVIPGILLLMVKLLITSC
jgi:siroheme synthase